MIDGVRVELVGRPVIARLGTTDGFFHVVLILKTWINDYSIIR